MTIQQKRKKAIDGLRFTMNMIVFNPSTGEVKDPARLNESDKTTYDACLFAIELLELDDRLEDDLK